MLDTINSKLLRKSDQLISDNIPYFSSLIKDSKRLSLIFENESNI